MVESKKTSNATGAAPGVLLSFALLLLMSTTILKSNAQTPATRNEQMMVPGVGMTASSQLAPPVAQGLKGDSRADGYTVQGKAVNKKQYDAAKLHDEGLLLMRSNNNEQALEKLKQAVSTYDGFAEIHHSLGLAYAKLGNNDAAISELKRAVELNPALADSWLLLAGFNQAAGKLTDAVSTYNEFLLRFPNHGMNAKVSASLGFLYAKLGKNEEAVAELVKAVEQNPSLAASWITLGGVYQAKGDIDRAIATYSQYLQRADKKEAMYSKINALVSSLNKERNSINNEKTQQEMLGVAKTNDEKTDETDETAEPIKKANDDYLGQMQRNGVGLTRWPKSRIPISVYITDGSKVDGYRDSMKNILRRCFDDWAKASDGGVTFVFASSPEQARLKCYWTNDRASLKNSSEAGDARVYEDQSYISNADIWFLTQPLTKSMPLTDNVFRMVALHEVGHALGLSGHTSNPEDIMFFSTTFKDSWRDLSGRDSRTIRRLYQSDI